MATNTKAERRENGTVRVQVIVPKEVWKKVQHMAIDQEVSPFELAGSLLVQAVPRSR